MQVAQTVLTGHNRDTMMSNKLNPKTDPGEPMVYHIRIKGHLGRQWTDCFEGLTITLEDNGDTLLTGAVVDQAVLHGMLKKVRDVVMAMVSRHHAFDQTQGVVAGAKACIAGNASRLHHTRVGCANHPVGLGLGQG